MGLTLRFRSSTDSFSAYTVMSSVGCALLPAQVAGAGASVGQTGLPFRIDHDEKFNQTTHLQYTISDDKLIAGVWRGLQLAPRQRPGRGQCALLWHHSNGPQYSLWSHLDNAQQATGNRDVGRDRSSTHRR